MMLAALLAALLFSQTPTQAATGRLAGRVTVEGANTPIAGARVILFPAGRPMGPMGPPPQTLTDQDGRFVFDRLAPGSYRVDAQKTGFASLNEPGRGPAPPAQLAAGQTLEISLQLQRGGVIAGKVLDASGEPLTDARVMALRRFPVNVPGMAGRWVPAAIQGPMQTNDLGEFRIAGLAPGEYLVAAMPRGGGPFGGEGLAPSSNGTAVTTTYYPGTIDQTGAQSVHVLAGETVNNIVFGILSVPAFRISGRVVDENDAPIAGAMVMLLNDPRGGAAFGPAGTARTGTDGRFTIADVPSGSYRITASVPIVMNSSGGAGGVTGGVTGGFTGGSASGSSFTTWSSVGGVTTTFGGGGEQPAEVTVNGANVTGVRVVARRPVPQ
jgi:protocatechuate 3,4-dioxygenase beta subunit